MNRDLRAISLLLLAYALPGVAEDTSARTYQLPDRGALQMRIPATWQDEFNPSADGGSPSVTIRPKKGDAFVVEIQILYPPRPAASSSLQAAILAKVKKEADQLVKTVGPQPLTFNLISGAAGNGYYFSLSEQNYKPGEYQHITAGMMQVGDVVPAFRILTNDGGEAEVQSLLAALKTATQGGSKAGTAAVPSGPRVGDVRIADATEDESRQLTSDVRRMTEVTLGLSDDIAFVLNTMYPRVKDLVGGESVLRRTIESARSSAQQRKLEIESFTFPSPPRTVRTGQRTYAIVPIRMVMKTGGNRGESLSFMVGVRDSDTGSWTYFDGRALNEELRRKWFPDFPVDYPFPAISTKKL